jgi:autoinducer 2-degrading protein
LNPHRVLKSIALAGAAFCIFALMNSHAQAQSTQVVAQVSLKIKPENVAAFMSKVTEIAVATRKEPGCKQYEVLVDPKDNTRAMLFEIYTDEKAVAAHTQTDHFKKYLAEAVPLLASRERQVWTRAVP